MTKINRTTHATTAAATGPRIASPLAPKARKSAALLSALLIAALIMLISTTTADAQANPGVFGEGFNDDAGTGSPPATTAAAQANEKEGSGSGTWTGGQAPQNLWNPITFFLQALMGSLATLALLIGAAFKTGAGPFESAQETGNRWIERGLKGYAFGVLATLTYWLIVG